MDPNKDTFKVAPEPDPRGDVALLMGFGAAYFAIFGVILGGFFDGIQVMLGAFAVASVLSLIGLWEWAGSSSGRKPGTLTLRGYAKGSYLYTTEDPEFGSNTRRGVTVEDHEFPASETLIHWLKAGDDVVVTYYRPDIIVEIERLPNRKSL